MSAKQDPTTKLFTSRSLTHAYKHGYGDGYQAGFAAGLKAAYEVSPKLEPAETERPKIRTFTLYWKHGEEQTVSAIDQGNQLDTLSAAMNEAGIGGGALPALDYWREVKGLVPGPSNTQGVEVQS